MIKKCEKKSETTAKSRKLGRPKSAIVRELRLPVRFSSEEIEQIRDSAERVGKSVSAWVRDRLGLDGTGYGER